MSHPVIRWTPGGWAQATVPALGAGSSEIDDRPLPPEPREQPVVPARAGVRVALDCALLALAASAVAATLMPLPSVRSYLIFAGAFLLPGGAIVTRLQLRDPLTIGSLMIGLSLAIDTAGALGLVWSRWYHPVYLAAGLVAISSTLIVVDLGIRLATLGGRHT